MLKAELVKEIVNKVNEENNSTDTSNKIEVTKNTVTVVLDALGDVIEDVVKNDDKVTLPKIGTFSVKTVPERKGTIYLGSKKGETYTVPEHKQPKFTMNSKFKKILV